MELYLKYHKGTEPPTIFHRWCAISMMATILGKNSWIEHGHSKIYPNQYIMLLGESGARKDTAIKAAVKLLRDSGFENIASSKTSKEKFLMDLQHGLDGENDAIDLDEVDKTSVGGLFESLGLQDDSAVSEGLIAAGEFNVFIGHGNIEFIDLLTDLWDYHGVFKQRFKTSKSIRVPNPYINMLIGNTAIGVSMSFPPEVVGQGFFSRLVIVYSDPSGRLVAFPPAPDQDVRIELISRLSELRMTYSGEVSISPEGKNALEEIYLNYVKMEDSRFRSYSARRFTHLLKLCTICAADRLSHFITLQEVITANTILVYTEFYMSQGLGQFGKAKNSDVTSRILDILMTSNKIVTHRSLWSLVSRDLEKPAMLADILTNLVNAGKVMVVDRGFIGVLKQLNTDEPHTNFMALEEYLERQEVISRPK